MTKKRKKKRKTSIIATPLRNDYSYKINTTNQVAPERFRNLRASFEKTELVTTLNNLQYTQNLNVLIYDYSYFVVNTGNNPAAAYLEVSPNGTNWEIQSAEKIIPVNSPLPAAQHVISFVPNVIAKYARLGYKSAQQDHPTTLTVYMQGR